MAKTAKLGTLGGKMVEYDPTNPEETKKAFMEVFNLSSEQYDAQQKRTQDRAKEEENKYPALNNLIWANNEIYYVDDQGKFSPKAVNIEEITNQMLAQMKEVNPDDTILINGEKHSRSAMLRADLAKAKIRVMGI